MPRRYLPAVLFIDDHPEETRSQRQLDLKVHARAKFLGLDDITPALLRSADLVLVDFDLRDWDRLVPRANDDNRQRILLPRDGLALLATLRAWVERGTNVDTNKLSDDVTPTAFALHTGQLDLLPGGDKARGREHVLAHAHGVEWIFTKRAQQGALPFGGQVESLACAARAVVRSWSTDESDGTQSVREAAMALLELPSNATWRAQAWREVEDCHPPLQEIAAATHGLAFLRWLLHRILPYPCFLLDERYLAARLRVTPKSLRSEMRRKNSQLEHVFRPARYGGIANNFLGTRWWRAGVETILWHMTKGQLASRQTTEGVLKEVAPLFRTVRPAHPVVSLTERLVPSDTLVDVDEAVEIRPDDWPPYAERAWVTRSLLDDAPDLTPLVVSQAGTELA